MNPVTGKLEKTDKGWRLPARCGSCGEELVLVTVDDEPPNPTAIKMGALMVCERCSDDWDAAVERRELEANRTRRLHAAGLPESLRGLHFDEMLAHEARAPAIAAAREWGESDSPAGLLIYGPVGVGKTRLAATAAWKRLERHPVTWISVAVLIAELGAAFGDQGRREAIKAITGEHPLILDDFDKVNPSDWVRSQLFAAIDRRAQARTPLLVTTNLAPSALRERFGEAIASRLAGLRTVKLEGPDYRQRLDGVL